MGRGAERERERGRREKKRTSEKREEERVSLFDIRDCVAGVALALLLNKNKVPPTTWGPKRIKRRDTWPRPQFARGPRAIRSAHRSLSLSPRLPNSLRTRCHIPFFIFILSRFARVLCCAVEEVDRREVIFLRIDEEGKVFLPRVMDYDSPPGAESIIASDLFPACDAPRSSAPTRCVTCRRIDEDRRGKRRRGGGIVRGLREREASRRIDTATIVGGVDPHLRSVRLLEEPIPHE